MSFVRWCHLPPAFAALTAVLLRCATACGHRHTPMTLVQPEQTQEVARESEPRKYQELSGVLSFFLCFFLSLPLSLFLSFSLSLSFSFPCVVAVRQVADSQDWGAHPAYSFETRAEREPVEAWSSGERHGDRWVHGQPRSFEVCSGEIVSEAAFSGECPSDQRIPRPFNEWTGRVKFLSELFRKRCECPCESFATWLDVQQSLSCGKRVCRPLSRSFESWLEGCEQ